MNALRSATVALVLLTVCAGAAVAPPPRLDGFNIIAAAGDPFGSAGAAHSLMQAKRLGAGAMAIVPFLWQATPSSDQVARGGDMPDAQLRAAIREVRGDGMLAVVKPHVWVPGSWAGAIAPTGEEGWRNWFADYQRAIVHLARVAAEEKAYAFVIGTELRQTVKRPEWPALIAKVRGVFPGLVFYVAHNIQGAEQVPFWPALDAIGVSLYPPLGADGDRSKREAVIADVTQRIDALATRYSRPVIVGEVGLRSAAGAAAEPWQSAEERAAKPDPQLQAAVLADWMRALDRPSVRGVLVWRWLSDPRAGGIEDTDFTVQGKPAAEVLQCAWTGACARAQAP
jgi:Glycoside Hydrolase Family 113